MARSNDFIFDRRRLEKSIRPRLTFRSIIHIDFINRLGLFFKSDVVINRIAKIISSKVKLFIDDKIGFRLNIGHPIVLPAFFLFHVI